MPPARTRPTDPDSKASASAHPYASHKRKTGDKTHTKGVDATGNAGGGAQTNGLASGSLLNWHDSHPPPTTPTHSTSAHLPLQSHTSEPTSSFLRTYVYAHRLPLPSFQSPLNAAILSTSSIALHSPTMAKRIASTSSQRGTSTSSLQRVNTAQTAVSDSGSEGERVGKVTPAQLVQGVRKHFNDLAVSESEVITEFVYVVKEGARREFRMRFAPGVGGKGR